MMNVSILSWFGLMLGDNSSVQIGESSVDLTLVGRNLDVALSDSTITWLGSHSSSGRFRFDNCELSNYAKFYDSSLEWSGSITIAPDITIGAWVNSTVRREYDLQLLDQAQKPVSGAELRLTNPIWHEQVLSSATTDRSGHASLTVPFTADDWQRWFPVTDASGQSLGTLRFFGPESSQLRAQ